MKRRINWSLVQDRIQTHDLLICGPHTNFLFPLQYADIVEHILEQQIILKAIFGLTLIVFRKPSGTKIRTQDC